MHTCQARVSVKLSQLIMTPILPLIVKLLQRQKDLVATTVKTVQLIMYEVVDPDSASTQPPTPSDVRSRGGHGPNAGHGLRHNRYIFIHTIMYVPQLQTAREMDRRQQMLLAGQGG